MRRKADDIDYEIKGADLQYVEVILDPKETVIAEPGTLMYMQEGVQFDTKLGDGSEKHSGVIGTLVGLGKRAFSDENLFVTFYTNNAQSRKAVAFAGAYPGKISAVDLQSIGGKLLCQRGSFLCGAKGVAVEFGFSKKIGFGLFGGEGFVLQKLSGDGLVFIHAAGGVEEKTLEKDELIYIDTGSLVAFSANMDFDIKMIRGFKNIFFGGEDLFLTSIKGPGKVWIQSTPFTRFVGNIVRNIVEAQPKGK